MGYNLKCYVQKKMDGKGYRMPDDALVVLKDVKKYYRVKSSHIGGGTRVLKALDGINMTIKQGETLGLVGESGCGKSTLGRLILGLEEPTGGAIFFDKTPIHACTRRDIRKLRRSMQLIFQDPYSSLNPRQRVASIIEEPLIIHRIGNRRERRFLVEKLMAEVGLHPEDGSRYPHEFSGGQRQRIGIARALALKPKFVVADEPVSALDVSIQAQIINLLIELQENFGLTYLFIAHDLNIVQHISDRIAVMYLGRIVEIVEKKDFSTPPQHPYTEALLAASPVLDSSLRRITTILEGDIPSPVTPPSGCAFHTRCPYKEEICTRESPRLRDVGKGHKIACHFR